MSPDNNGRKRVMKTATMTVAERKACCILVLLFQLAPLLRYCDSLRYALKSRNSRKKGDQEGQRHFYLKMLKEDQDVALLRVFECFLEAAPQQILQLTILLTDRDKTDFQGTPSGSLSLLISFLISFISSHVPDIQPLQFSGEHGMVDGQLSPNYTSGSTQ